ncbi:SDR family oxidoreductase [Nonomuraea diastatica]|uniref:SDR family oxidoreductase n=1 Tax=Nonomuraea diastatica TaxID=1848329 RepID=UPI003CCC63F0
MAGATGRIGGRVVHELTAAGAAVRALTRRPDDVQLPGGAVAMLGDLRVAASVEPAFEGVDVAYLFPVPGWPVADLLALARKAGVRRIVLLSSASLPGGPSLIERQHRANEDAVRASGMLWTFVRPTAFMANDLSWAPAIRAEDTVYHAFPDASLAPVDEHDIAAKWARAGLNQLLERNSLPQVVRHVRRSPMVVEPGREKLRHAGAAVRFRGGHEGVWDRRADAHRRGRPPRRHSPGAAPGEVPRSADRVRARSRRPAGNAGAGRRRARPAAAPYGGAPS